MLKCGSLKYPVRNQKGALGGYKKGDLVKLEEIRDVTILIQDPQIRKRKSRSDQTTQLVENIQWKTEVIIA